MSEAQEILDYLRAGGLDLASAAVNAATSKDDRMMPVAKDLVNCLKSFNAASKKLEKLGAVIRDPLCLEKGPRGSNRDSDMSMGPLGEYSGDGLFDQDGD